jgi:hypothetical protein
MSTWEQPAWLAEMPNDAASPPVRFVNPQAASLDLEARPYAIPQPVRIQLSGNPCRVPTCGYLAGDAYVCPTCVEAWETQLGNMAALIEDLELAQRGHPKQGLAIPLDAQDRILFADPKMPVAADDQTVGPGTVEYQKWAARVSVDNRRASYWLARIRAELVGQVRLICEDVSIQTPAIKKTVTMSRWLLRQAHRLPYLPPDDGWGLVHDLDQCYRDAVDAIDAPHRAKYVRVCTCGVSVWAKREKVTCKCGIEYDVAAEHEVRMVRAEDYLLTVNEAQRLSGIPRNTIKSWITRKQLEVRGSRKVVIERDDGTMVARDEQTVRYGDVVALSA